VRGRFQPQRWFFLDLDDNLGLAQTRLKALDLGLEAGVLLG
jgi:hypothetical protein